MAQTLTQKKVNRIVKEALAQGRTLSIIFDYDGTLTPIVAQPEDAILDNEMLKILKDMEMSEQVKMAVLSGRTSDTLQHFLGELSHTKLVGDHGAEIERRNTFKAFVSQYLVGLRWLAEKYPGCYLEDKEVALGVHYRNIAQEAAAEFIAVFFNWWLLNGEMKLFQVAAGKKVFEIRPSVKSNKGTAVIELLNSWYDADWMKKTLPIYFGDDITDEDAFKALKKYLSSDAVTILVADNPRLTAANYRAPDVNTIKQILRWILSLLIFHHQKNENPTHPVNPC
ncbi:MAG: trehalose-phosphatase [bacterium]